MKPQHLKAPARKFNDKHDTRKTHHATSTSQGCILDFLSTADGAHGDAARALM
jgi:hypothetical protein